MKALVVEKLSSDLSGLQLIDWPDPEGEILVRVRAASLNFPDLLMTRGEYQFRPELPFVSGMEMSGDVIQAHPDSGFRSGDRVMGGYKTGAFAEIVAVRRSDIRLMPSDIDYETAATLGAAYSTAYIALLELAQLQSGQSVLVHGASGGVGLAACHLAKAMGAYVIAATHQPHKSDALALASGADAVLVTQGSFRTQVGALTNGNLCDVVFDPVGGDTFDESTRCVTFGGKLLVVGFAGGRIPTVAANIPLIKGFSIVGVRAGEYLRRFPDRAAPIYHNLFALLAEGRFAPHIDRVVDIQDWREAFSALANGKQIGKIVLKP